jgi:hypothetical protein
MIPSVGTVEFFSEIIVSSSFTAECAENAEERYKRAQSKFGAFIMKRTLTYALQAFT